MFLLFFAGVDDDLGLADGEEAFSFDDDLDLGSDDGDSDLFDSFDLGDPSDED